jgi:hypothetical protein
LVLFDTPAQRAWLSKQIAIRVSARKVGFYATPKWVQDAGAKGTDFEFGKGPKPGGPLWDPDYLDPVFLAKLDRFLAAMALRYDGNPNVAFIDVGSFGMWGEGHTGFSSQLNEERWRYEEALIFTRNISRARFFVSVTTCGSGAESSFPMMDYAVKA